MAFIYKTKNFIVDAFETPHVSREEGGNVKIYPKKKIENRWDMGEELAREFILLTMLVGKALKIAMTNRGVEIMRVNFHDMGNWAFKKRQKPYFHIHIYGRAKGAKHQPYKEAVKLPDRSTGFYDDFKPLNKEDIEEVRKQMEKLMKDSRFGDLRRS